MGDEALVQKVVQIILDEGGAPGSSLHSWRCEYPDRYSPCDCVPVTARMIVDALAADVRAEERERVYRFFEREGGSALSAYVIRLRSEADRG